MRQLKYEKVLKRCPECGSSNIHKRTRILIVSGNKKGRWIGASKNKHNVTTTTTKIYKCYNCKYEFDTPLVSEQNSD